MPSIRTLYCLYASDAEVSKRMQVSHHHVSSPLQLILSVTDPGYPSHHSTGLGNRIGSLACGFLILTSDLILSLFVAVRDHAIDQAAWFAMWVGFVFLCLVGFLVDVLCRFLIGFVMFVEVDYTRMQR